MSFHHTQSLYGRSAPRCIPVLVVGRRSHIYMPSGLTTLRLGVDFIHGCLFHPMVYRLPSSGTARWCCFRSTLTLYSVPALF